MEIFLSTDGRWQHHNIIWTQNFCSHIKTPTIKFLLEVWAKKISLNFIPATFYWSACAKPRKWVVINLCAWSIDFPSFYDFSIGFSYCSDSVVFFVLHFICIIYTIDLLQIPFLLITLYKYIAYKDMLLVI